MMLLCIGESPAKGEYTLPEGLDFWERKKKLQEAEEQKVREMEKDIWQELERNQEYQSIKREWRQEIEDEGSRSNWTDSDEELHDMQIDKPEYYVNSTENVERELDQVFQEEKMEYQNKLQTETEK